MKTSNIALSTGATLLLAFVTYAWADSTPAPEAAAEAEASAETSDAPARLCIPQDEANAAADATEEVKPEGEAAAEGEAASEGDAPAAEGEAVAEGDAPAAEGEAAAEGDASVAEEEEAEAALPICDEDGNPPEPAKPE